MRRFFLALLAFLALSAPVAAWYAGGQQLQGFEVGGVAPATVTFGDCVIDTTDLTTYSFTLNTGTAGANRHTVIVAFGLDGASAYNVTGITVGGDAANEVVDEDATGLPNSAIYILANPAGTSETTEVTFSEQISVGAACAFALYDLQSATAFASTADDDTASGALVLDLNTPADGVAVGGCINNTLTAAATWTGMIERDEQTGGGGTQPHTISVADFDEDASASTPLSVTCDLTGTTDASGVTASFR